MKPKLFLLNLFFGLLIFGLAQIETLGHHGQDVESLRDAEYTTLPTTSRIGALP
ncbi:unnamed protein product [Brassica oleracea var. botrytis]